MLILVFVHKTCLISKCPLTPITIIFQTQRGDELLLIGAAEALSVLLFKKKPNKPYT